MARASKATSRGNSKSSKGKGDTDEKRRYVGVMSCWLNNKWDDIVEPKDSGMTVSIRPTEAEILIGELQKGIDGDRNTQLYLMDNQYKRDDKDDPDFKVSVLVDADYAQECYDKLKGDSGGATGKSRRSSRRK